MASDGFSFAEGWEARMGMEPCYDAPPDWLPTGWRIAIRAESSGKQRKWFVSPSGLAKRRRVEVEAISLDTPRKSRKNHLNPWHQRRFNFDFSPGWEEKLGFQPLNARDHGVTTKTETELPAGWKLAIKLEPTGKRRKMYVNCEGKYTKNREEVFRISGQMPPDSNHSTSTEKKLLQVATCSQTDSRDGSRALHLGQQQPSSFDFSPGWEDRLGLQPYANDSSSASEMQLPPGWRLAVKIEASGKRRKVYVNSQGRVTKTFGDVVKTATKETTTKGGQEQENRRGPDISPRKRKKTDSSMLQVKAQAVKEPLPGQGVAKNEDSKSSAEESSDSSDSSSDDASEASSSANSEEVSVMALLPPGSSGKATNQPVEAQKVEEVEAAATVTTSGAARETEQRKTLTTQAPASGGNTVTAQAVASAGKPRLRVPKPWVIDHNDEYDLDFYYNEETEEAIWEPLPEWFQ